jgi:hypothetical protein
MRISDLTINKFQNIILNVRVFKNTWFNRFTHKENIGDEELRALIEQLETGQADAEYGRRYL